MSSWDAAQYLKFGSERLRPAIDLIGRITLEAPKTVVDLGCGAGNVTRILAERWPDAEVFGIDSSPSMLERARRASGKSVKWIEADLADWRPEYPVDLIFSNAALHWLDDHDALFSRLMSSLSPDGVLAVQMPRNHGAPALTAICDIARDGPWTERLTPILRPSPVAAPEHYFSVLSELGRRSEIWETVYYQVLTGRDPIVEFSRGTVLRPILDALEGTEADLFLQRYASLMAEAYPRRRDGTTLYPFRRLFLMAFPGR